MVAILLPFLARGNGMTEIIEGTPWRTVREAAELMGLHYTYLRRKIVKGGIKEEYLLRVNPRMTLVHIRAIKEYLEQQKHEGKVRRSKKQD